jgi:hypothetical protein
MFLIFVDLYAWAAFFALVVLLIILREINLNLIEISNALKSKQENI